MKIFRVTYHYDKFWRAVTNIGGVDVIHIDADNCAHEEHAPRVDSKHFITYNKEDQINLICGWSNICDTILLIKDKILSRIEDDEDIVFLDQSHIGDIWTLQLKNEKSFRLHLVKEIYDSTEDSEYLPYLRTERNKFIQQFLLHQ